jgi:hypothetical protein
MQRRKLQHGKTDRVFGQSRRTAGTDKWVRLKESDLRRIIAEEVRTALAQLSKGLLRRNLLPLSTDFLSDKTVSQDVRVQFRAWNDFQLPHVSSRTAWPGSRKGTVVRATVDAYEKSNKEGRRTVWRKKEERTEMGEKIVKVDRESKDLSRKEKEREDRNVNKDTRRRKLVWRRKISVGTTLVEEKKEMGNNDREEHDKYDGNLTKLEKDKASKMTVVCVGHEKEELEKVGTEEKEKEENEMEEMAMEKEQEAETKKAVKEEKEELEKVGTEEKENEEKEMKDAGEHAKKVRELKKVEKEEGECDIGRKGWKQMQDGETGVKGKNERENGSEMNSGEERQKEVTPDDASEHGRQLLNNIISYITLNYRSNGSGTGNGDWLRLAQESAARQLDEWKKEGVHADEVWRRLRETHSDMVTQYHNAYGRRDDLHAKASIEMIRIVMGETLKRWRMGVEVIQAMRELKRRKEDRS